jgi:putative heme-binding domain-containing protein
MLRSLLSRFVPTLISLQLTAALCVGHARGDNDAPLPHWIWSDDWTDDAPREPLRFEHSFEVAGAVQSASLRLASDFVRLEVRVNDQPIVVVEPYAPWPEFEVAAYLRPGVNHWRVTATPPEGPRGWCGELDLRFADGTRRQVLTGDDWWVSAAEDAVPSRQAKSLGPITRHHWDVGNRSIDITTLDDYEQWRDASGTGEGTTPARFQHPDGFAVEELRVAGAEEGSWINLEFEPQGRLLIAREDQGLLRLTLDPATGDVQSVEPVPAAAELKECRGLAFSGHDLYVNANNSLALYRLPDADGDGEFEAAVLVREFPGTVGHGRNDLHIRNEILNSIHGDAVDLPTTEITDLTSPIRAARRGERTSEGGLLTYDLDDSQWSLICAGLRNPYGVDFHPQHETSFTYDADAEHDMGAPWYRPTRIVQLQPGADFGWRGVTGQWPPYYPDQPEFAPPVMDIGKGSPTCVKFGAGSNFPAPYRDALYVLDWAYGRVIAVHLIPRGAGYYGWAEVFLRGRPLNVTDLEFGPDGAMYLVTGGRQTRSGLYRVRYPGESQPTAPTVGLYEVHRDRFFSLTRQAEEDGLRQLLLALAVRKLSRLKSAESEAREASALEPLNSHDPALRSRFRTVVERDGASDADYLSLVWSAYSKNSRLAELELLLACARRPECMAQPRILAWLNKTILDSETTRVIALRVYRLALRDPQAIDPELLADTRERLESLIEDAPIPTIGVLGQGLPSPDRLIELLVLVESPRAIETGLRRLRAATDQSAQLQCLFALRSVRTPWTLEQRQLYFAVLGDLAAASYGGAGMPSFLQSIRDEAVATLTPEEQTALAAAIAAPTETNDEPPPARPLVREWTLDALAPLAESEPHGDASRGRELFQQALCSRCHRAGALGRSLGPDLTSVAARFSRLDLLRSLVEPSAVVAEPYRTLRVVTRDGRTLSGQVVVTGDYRDRLLRLRTDPLRPREVTEILKGEIEHAEELGVSPMPAGLLNTLTEDEIRDLLEFLVTMPGGE